MKNQSLCILILFLQMMVNIMVGQVTSNDQLTSKEKKIFDEAKSYAQKGDLKKSTLHFEKLIALKPGFVEGNLRLASNYYQLKDYIKSESLFVKSIALSPDYDPEMYYSLATVQNAMKKYLPAASHYKIYASKEKVKKDKIAKALKLSANLMFIDSAIQHPVPFEPKNIGLSINSDQSEYSPSISLDGQSMIFTRNIKKQGDFIGQEDFYQSMLDSAGWSEAFPITDLNTHQNEGAFSISANGKYIVFTACERREGFGSCDLYYSMWQDGKWTNPVNMGNKVNSAAWDSQPSLSSDGRVLIFTSRRLGTYGGSDLWITYKNEKNAWVNPINMGPIINSTGDDESPFLHPDGCTLYFRSNGRVGMGDFDIYFSRKNDTSELWQTPLNLGYPINTEGSEGSLTVSIDGKKAYYASDNDLQNDVKMNHLDIFSFDLYEEARPKSTTFVKGYITDIVTGQPLSAKVTITDLKSGKSVFEVLTGEDGYFISGITAGNNYACIAENKNYLFHAENFNLADKIRLFDPYILKIRLIPISKTNPEKEINLPIVLQNIFFKSGSFELLPSSNTEIDLLVKMLRQQPDISIKIIGHTDNIGDENDNLILSELRAKEVSNAIIKKGIASQRVTWEGKGESIPIDTNDTAEGRQKNRRTEFQIN